MEAATALKVILILGGCLLLPLFGGLFEKYQKLISNFGITSMFLGSLVSLAGFRLCVSWNCLCSSCGQRTALIVFLIAWLTFLFLSFSVYSTQLKA